MKTPVGSISSAGRSIWRRIGPSLAAQATAIFLLTVLVRVIMMLVTGLHREMFMAELQKIAQSLACSGVFGNPYLLPTGPSAHAAPPYTVLAAGVFYLFGANLEGQLLLFLVNIGLTGLQFALIPFVAATMGMDRRVGFLAGLVAALLPMHYKIEIRAGDAPLCGAMLVALFILTLWDWRKEGWTLVRAAVLGLAWGFGAFANNALLPVFAAVVVVTLMRKSRGQAASRRLAVVGLAVASTLAAFAVLAPWTIRNHLSLGGFVIGRSNLGLEMRLAYNDFAKPDMLSNYNSGATGLYHPFMSLEAARAVVREGEVAYNHRLLRDALGWIADNPSRATRLTVTRFVHFWFPKTPEVSRIVILSVLSVLAFAGLLLLRRRSPDSVQLIVAVWVAYPLIFYLLVSSPRYRYPLTWMFLTLAAHAVNCGVNRMRNAEFRGHNT